MRQLREGSGGVIAAMIAVLAVALLGIMAAVLAVLLGVHRMAR